MLTLEVEWTVREAQQQNPTLIQVLDLPIVYSSITLSVPRFYRLFSQLICHPGMNRTNFLIHCYFWWPTQDREARGFA